MRFDKWLSAAAAVLLIHSVHAADTIKIGFNTPLTGFAAADGKSALTGAELALEQVNAGAAQTAGCWNWLSMKTKRRRRSQYPWPTS